MQLPEACDSQSGARIFRRMTSQEAEQSPTTSCYPTPSQPIDIRSPQRNRLAIHFNTAPATTSLVEDMARQRMNLFSKPMRAQENEANMRRNEVNRTYGIQQDRQPFQECPERILEEAIQRMNMLYKYSYADSDKENSQRRQNFESGFMIDGICEVPSGYDELVHEETDTESVGSDCQSNCCCAADYWEMDYESLTPTEFRSVGDIIGYAKVVRAQRQEALGQLNSVMNQFSDAWSTMRKQLEARRAAATAEQNQA
jgi:hypothetical protein